MKMEAERLRKEEEAALKKKMNAKKAKEEAEKHHQVQDLLPLSLTIWYWKLGASITVF